MSTESTCQEDKSHAICINSNKNVNASKGRTECDAERHNKDAELLLGFHNAALFLPFRPNEHRY